ncbi:MAG: hypothetical protein QNJ56_02315 [Gammaproteobacteria bacterium]|nr:hypothetical protein [Gammaproteobacteria bacterium]
MVDFIIAILAILMLLSGWIVVQHLANVYASKHPELGPARQEGGGCGKSCLCSGNQCKNKTVKNQEELSHDLPQ